MRWSGRLCDSQAFKGWLMPFVLPWPMKQPFDGMNMRTCPLVILLLPTTLFAFSLWTRPGANSSVACHVSWRIRFAVRQWVENKISGFPEESQTGLPITRV